MCVTMAGKKSPYKNAIVSVRFPERFKRIMEQIAYNDGLDLSAWIRFLIISELKRRGALPETFSTHSLEEALEKLAEKTEAGS